MGLSRAGCSDVFPPVTIRKIAIWIATGIGLCAALTGWMVWTGRWVPNAIVASAYVIRGIDVSHHQGVINWPEVARDHVDFVYMKATEGADFVDQRFGKNWRQAAAQRIPRGAYHFYNPATSGRNQARHFVATVPVDPHALPPAVDLEFAVGATPRVEDFRRELAEFLVILRAAYGKEPVIYTTAEFQRHYLAGTGPRRLWIREVVGVPSGEWLFWQFSSRGRVRGIANFVDLNAFSGERADLEALMAER